MESFGANPLWDLSLPPSLPALADDDFIALLQKQFGVNNGFPGLDTGKDTDSPAANINPQSLTRLPIPRPAESPPSDDSSPSPNEATTSRSRRESLFGVPGSSRDSEDGGDDDPSLKRKASEDDLDDEPNHKHTSSSKRNTNSRRKSTGTTNPDESRLLKRKEQNRAAQRAFRERKEKHVKDLEDKVAALEEKNQAATNENESLREVVSRLQSENVRLRQSSFTFSVPPSSSTASSSTADGPDPNRSVSADLQQETPMTLFNSPPSTTTSTTASTHDSPQSLFNDNNDGQLSFLGQNITMLNPGHQQQTATGDAMNLDFGFGPITQTPYTTIASNPLFMSFREPDPFDPAVHQNQGSQSGHGFDFSQQLFSGWPDVNMDVMGASSMPAFDLTNSLDELFGSSFANGGHGVDFMQVNKASPSASLSPVSHQNSNKSSPGMSSTPSSAGSSPQTGASPGASNGDMKQCDGSTKCTKENLAKFVALTGDSMFTPRQAPPRSDASSPSPPESGMGDNDACSEFPPCKGLQLPKTQKSEKNVEVMSAWRVIRHDPKYQDVDINQLCSEFASKAKCDGCQVVIEPSGMQEILETVQKHKKTKQQSGLFSASQSAGLLSK